jgi:hypothetical protein
LKAGIEYNLLVFLYVYTIAINVNRISIVLKAEIWIFIFGAILIILKFSRDLNCF